MARSSAYERQLAEVSRLVAEISDAPSYRVAWQSRSGPPQIPWLEPDILDVLEEVAAEEKEHVIVVPAGFISDHLEVLFDLDLEAAEKAQDLGLQLVRIPAVGTDPQFIDMIRELIQDRMVNNPQRLALGNLGPWHDVCPSNCCRLGTDRSPLPTVAERM
jgi:ferrochelatase